MALSLHLQLKELELGEDFTGPLSAEILLHTPHNRGTIVVGTTVGFLLIILVSSADSCL